MDAARIVGRIYDNLSWAAPFDPDAPFGAAALPAELGARVESAWGEPDERFVALLFPWLLGRPADPADLTAYRALLAAGASRCAVVRRLALSDEARAWGLDVSWLPRLDALEPDIVRRRVRALGHAADRTFVEGLFPLLLVRPPDEASVTAYCAVLAGGVDRSIVVRALALSEEVRAWGLDASWLSYLEALDSETAWRRLRALWPAPDRAFVEGLFGVLLVRPADRASLKAYCAALAEGKPRSALAREMALSEEARAWGPRISWLAYLDGLDAEVVWGRVRALWGAPDQGFVEGLFTTLLARPADPASLADFCAALADGRPRSAVARDIALSEEARAWSLDVSWLPRLADLEPAAPPAAADRYSIRSLRSLFRRWMSGRKAPAPLLSPAPTSSLRPVAAGQVQGA